jgi:hypothetical protein
MEIGNGLRNMNRGHAAGERSESYCQNRCCFSLVSPCLADVALIVGEPYGQFGAWAPTGHAAVYLTRVAPIRRPSFAAATPMNWASLAGGTVP